MNLPEKFKTYATMAAICATMAAAGLLAGKWWERSNAGESAAREQIHAIEQTNIILEKRIKIIYQTNIVLFRSNVILDRGIHDADAILGASNLPDALLRYYK